MANEKHKIIEKQPTAILHVVYRWQCPFCKATNLRAEEWTDDTCETCGARVHMKEN